MYSVYATEKFRMLQCPILQMYFRIFHHVFLAFFGHLNKIHFHSWKAFTFLLLWTTSSITLTPIFHVALLKLLICCLMKRKSRTLLRSTGQDIGFTRTIPGILQPRLLLPTQFPLPQKGVATTDVCWSIKDMSHSEANKSLYLWKYHKNCTRA